MLNSTKLKSLKERQTTKGTVAEWKRYDIVNETNPLYSRLVFLRTKKTGDSKTGVLGYHTTKRTFLIATPDERLEYTRGCTMFNIVDLDEYLSVEKIKDCIY